MLKYHTAQVKSQSSMIMGLYYIPNLDSNEVQLCCLRLGELPDHGQFHISFSGGSLTETRVKYLFLLALASYLLVYHGKLDSYDGKLLEHLCAVVCYSIPCKFSKDENGKVAFSFHFSCSLGTSAIATRTHLIKSPVQRTFVS